MNLPDAAATARSLRTDAHQLVQLVGRALRPRRRLGKALWLLIATFWMLAVASGAAHAVYGTQTVPVDPGPGSMYDSLSSAQDRHGLALSDYTISVDSGGLREPVTAISSFLLGFSWDIYRLGVGVGMWMLETVTGFTWLDLLRAPAETLANVLSTVIGDLGVVPALATLSVLVSGFLLLRGRTATAFSEIAVTAVVVALFATVLVNPVGTIAGDNGLIAQSKNLGVGLSHQLMGQEDDLTGEVQLPTGEVMQVLVRIPHQYVNYAAYIDVQGEGCVEAYNTLLQSGEDNYGDLGGPCGQSVVDAADNPTAALPVMFMVYPGAGLLVVFTTILCLCLVLLTAFMLWEGAKFVWEMVKALMPGTARAGMIQSAINLLIAAALLVGGLMGVAVYVMVLLAVYDATAEWDPVDIFVFVDIMLFAAIMALIMYFVRGRGQGKAWGRRAAEALNRRGPGSVAPPSRTLALAKTAGASAVGMASARMTGGAVARRSSGGPDPSGSSGGSGSSSTPPRSRLRTAAKVGGTVAKTGARVALGTTVLAPVEGPRAARAAMRMAKARRAAVQTKINAARAKAGARVDQARDYRDEYAANVRTAGRWASKAASHARPGRPFTPDGTP